MKQILCAVLTVSLSATPFVEAAVRVAPRATAPLGGTQAAAAGAFAAGVSLPALTSQSLTPAFSPVSAPAPALVLQPSLTRPSAALSAPAAQVSAAAPREQAAASARAAAVQAAPSVNAQPRFDSAVSKNAAAAKNGAENGLSPAAEPKQDERAGTAGSLRGLSAKLNGAASASTLSAAFDGMRSLASGDGVAGRMAADGRLNGIFNETDFLRLQAEFGGAGRLAVAIPSAPAKRQSLAARAYNYLKASLFHAVTTVQRLRRGKPKVPISPATAEDVDAILAIVQAARDELKDKDSNASGFFLGSYTREDYLGWIDSGDAQVLVARDKQGKPIGVALAYGSSYILRDAASKQELNRVALAAVRRDYGPSEELVIVKHVAVHPDAKRLGVGPQLVNAVVYDTLLAGHSFIAGTIVNDDPLKGSALDRPEARLLRNLASQRMAAAVGGKLVLEGFVYSGPLAEFLADPAKYYREHPEGIHAFELRMRSFSRNRRIPRAEVPPQNTAPKAPKALHPAN